MYIVKKKFQNTLFVLIISLSLGSLKAQEFDLDILISSRASSQVDPALYNDLKQNVENFYNGTKWSDEEFAEEELIEGQITFTIVREINSNTFVADLLIQSKRPVFKSNYKTTMLNYLDRGITITYNPGQPLFRSDNSFSDELSSTLTFYAYVMLGLDFDSFAALGGENYFKSAQNVINGLPPGLQNSEVWNNTGGIITNNKYWLLENLTNPRMRAFRQFFYEYHRLGLDGMYNDPDKQRAIITSSFMALNDVVEKYPNALILSLFSDAKATELVDIFKAGDRGQMKRVYDIMVACAPAHAVRYAPLEVRS